MGQYYQIEGISALDALLSECYKDNAKMKKQMRQMMTNVIKDARKKVSEAAAGALDSDPRRARNAVRSSVYKALLGGQVNILSTRKAGKRSDYGSHSRPRSERTEQLDSYYGKDRGFVLRFINAGVNGRTVKTMNAHSIQRSEAQRFPLGTQKNRHYKPARKYKGGLGNRGGIEAKGWFAPAAGKSMQEAAEKFAELVDRAINEVWNQQ